MPEESRKGRHARHDERGRNAHRRSNQPFVPNQPAVERPEITLRSVESAAVTTTPTATSEIGPLWRSLRQAIQQYLVSGTRDILTQAIAEGISRGIKSNGGLVTPAPAPEKKEQDPNETWVSGSEYEKLTSITRQKDERIAELRRQTLSAEADIQRLKSQLESKEQAIQDKLIQISKANAEKKTVKLQMVDLESKVRVMRKDTEDAAIKTRLAENDFKEAKQETEATRHKLDELEALKVQHESVQANLELAQDALAELKAEAFGAKGASSKKSNTKKTKQRKTTASHSKAASSKKKPRSNSKKSNTAVTRKTAK